MLKIKISAKNPGKICAFYVLAWLLLPVAAAEARVCFLPGNSLCDIMPREQMTCTGYNLTQIFDADNYCASGWNCNSCRHLYKCAKKSTPAGYTEGLYACSDACEEYSYSGCTGSKINGRCDKIEGGSKTKPGHCTKYNTPDYVYGAEISGMTVKELMSSEDSPRHDCYTDITEMEGYTAETPAHCTKFDKDEGSDGVMCYANVRPLDGNYSTEPRDEAFTYDEAKGDDGETCYKVKGCNTAKNWVEADKVDGNIFNYTPKNKDGIFCRHPVGCNEKNDWHATVSASASAEKQTVGGQTCYKELSCEERYSESEGWYESFITYSYFGKCAGHNYKNNKSPDLTNSAITVCVPNQCMVSAGEKETCDGKNYYRYKDPDKTCPDKLNWSDNTCRCVCTSNDNCKNGQYCQITSWPTTFNTKTSKTEYKYLEGNCINVGEIKNAEITDFGTVLYQYGKKYGYRGDTPDANWWSAHNWCLALGKELINPENFGCYDSKGKKQNFYLSDPNNSVPCFASNGYGVNPIILEIYEKILKKVEDINLTKEGDPQHVWLMSNSVSLSSYSAYTMSYGYSIWVGGEPTDRKTTIGTEHRGSGSRLDTDPVIYICH